MNQNFVSFKYVKEVRR